MLLRRSFSPLTLQDIRALSDAPWELCAIPVGKTGIQIISAQRLTYLCAKYDLSRIEAALLMQATIDQYGRIAE